MLSVYSLNGKRKVKRGRVPQYEKWSYAGTEELAKTKAGQISKGIFDTDSQEPMQHHPRSTSKPQRDNDSTGSGGDVTWAIASVKLLTDQIYT